MIDWNRMIADPNAPTMCEAFGLCGKDEEALMQLILEAEKQAATVAELLQRMFSLPLSDTEKAYATYMVAVMVTRAFEDLDEEGGTD